jgi:hypothetical protein
MPRTVQALNVVLLQSALQSPFEQDIVLINTLAEVAKGVSYWFFSPVYVQGH